MKCYIHKDKEAVGCCKNCSKPICEICVIDTGNGYACSENCKLKILILNRIIFRLTPEGSVQIIKNMSIGFSIMALIFLLLPILTQELAAIIVPIMFGTIALISYLVYRIWLKKQI